MIEALTLIHNRTRLNLSRRRALSLSCCRGAPAPAPLRRGRSLRRKVHRMARLALRMLVFVGCCSRCCCRRWWSARLSLSLTAKWWLLQLEVGRGLEG